MDYTLSAADIESITPAEFGQGTTRLLPPIGAVPLEIQQGHGPYYQLAQAMMYGEQMADGEVTINPEYPDTEEFMSQFIKCAMGHLFCLDVDHDERLMCVAYMISKVITIS